jgi:hypothetical protein
MAFTHKSAVAAAKKSWEGMTTYERFRRASHAAVCRWTPPPEPPPPVPAHVPAAVQIIERAIDATGDSYAAGYYARSFRQLCEWLERVARHREPPSSRPGG